MIEEYLTAPDISKALKISVEFVYKHAEEFGGIKIGKKLWRFPKSKLEKKLGVMNRGYIQTQEEMDVRLLEKRGEIQAGGVYGKTGSGGSRSESENHVKSDKYGLREVMRKQTGGR